MKFWQLCIRYLAVSLFLSPFLHATATTFYVNCSNAVPVWPYTNWSAAATNIQDAVDTASAGDLVLVTNGTYQNGGRPVYGYSALFNRVAVTIPLTIQSVNGPAVTTIVGYQIPGTTNGDGAVRCVYLTNGILSGFTLTNGATRSAGDQYREQSGGGVCCGWTNALVTNCIIVGNSAAQYGGGANGTPYYGVMNNCVLSNNTAYTGGGSYGIKLTNCTVVGNFASYWGGGAYECLLYACSVTENSAPIGGGADNCTLYQCNVAGNTSTLMGAGADSSDLWNCNLTGNATSGRGGGASQSTLSNCVVSANTAGNWGGGGFSSQFVSCALQKNSANNGGGAVLGALTNCTLTGNFATNDGGGAESAQLSNCLLSDNSSAGSGGGVSGGSSSNCTITGNSAITGGGAYQAQLYNSILYYNRALDGNYDFSSTLNYCCTVPLPTNGIGNLPADPQLASVSHLSVTSPCRGAGNALYATGVDIDGETWLAPPSIGCDEYHSGFVTGPLTVALIASYTNLATGLTNSFEALVVGRTVSSTWKFGDGITVSNQPYVNHAWSSPGDYNVILTAYNDANPAGVSASATIHVLAQPVYFVAHSSNSPVAPYASWATAATNIQDAVDAAALSVPGGLVLVNDGVYQFGGRTARGALTNRVSVIQPMTLQSLNGPATTIISGYQVPGSTNGDSAVRCLYLTNGTTVNGFTLVNGATRKTGSADQEQSGGAAWCEPGNVLLTNCVIEGNAAAYYGGGVYRGWLAACVLSNNLSSIGGGAYQSTLSKCTLQHNFGTNDGGGAAMAMLSDCTISNNFSNIGGGAYRSVLSNCRLTGNSAAGAGGVDTSTLNGCALWGNSATNGVGGGAARSFLYNCSINSNSAAGAGGVSGGVLTNCTLIGNIAVNEAGGADSANLTNCTLMFNSAAYGGASYCSYSGLLCNCTLISNTAIQYGGGSYGGTLINCAVIGNSVAAASGQGGGAYESFATNCTFTANSALQAGAGVYSSTAYNCIIYFNQSGGDFSGGTLVNCCTSYNAGGNNIAADPQLADLSHLSINSPCRGAGASAYSTGVDIDGEAWLTPPAIGCDEYRPGSVDGPLTVSIGSIQTNVAPGFSLTFWALVGGRTSGSSWDFGDQTAVTNRPIVSHSWVAPGNYPLVLRAWNESNPAGITATAIVHVAQPVHYVSIGSISSTPPYSSWTTAATNIQDAVDAASAPGALILVSNGLYQTGGRVAYGSMTNRLSIYKPLVVRSVNGPGVTVIRGLQQAFTTNGNSAIRCVYMTNAAVISGFTLSSGATRTAGDSSKEQSGGGVWCESTTAIVTNCIITGNSANYAGGGMYQGTLNNCIVSSNSAGSEGGGAFSGALNGCWLYGNSCRNGGGVYSSALTNCFLTGNSAIAGGGGVGAAMIGCTIVGNFASSIGGGSDAGNLKNCIIYNNTATGQTNGNFDAYGFLYFCCTKPLAANGTGNINSDPLFINAVAGNYRLQSNSPCINAGNNSYIATATDLDGRPRIVGGTVDIGAYEYQGPGMGEFTAWLQQYNLPTDGSADSADTDHNGMSNWQKWRAGLNPTNPASVLALSIATNSGSGLNVTWQSVTNITYYLQRATALGASPAFSSIQSNIVGQSGVTTYTDTNAPLPGPLFYRVGVQ